MLKRLSVTFNALIVTLSFMLGSQIAQAKEDIFVTMGNINCHKAKEGHGVLQCKLVKPTMAFKNQQGELKEPPLTMEAFIELWKKDNHSGDSFGDNPPNAILTFSENGHTCQAELVLAKAYLKDGDIHLLARPLSKDKAFKIDGEKVSEKEFLKHIHAKDKSSITMLIDDIWCLMDGRC